MKIIGDYGYVVKNEEGYHVYGDETDETQGTELTYRMDPNELESVPMDFPVYADVHDFDDEESSNMHREAWDFMDKEHLLLEVKRLIMTDETIPLCDENIYFIAKQALAIADWQDLSDFIWNDFASEDLPVYKKELPVQPVKAEDNPVNVDQSTLLNAVMKYKAEHQKDLALVSSIQAVKDGVYLKLSYDVVNDDVYVTYCDGNHGDRKEQCWLTNVQDFQEYEGVLNATLAIVKKNVRRG